MATVPTQVRIDEDLKKQATELFSQLGMDMSSAMNIFLRQCVMRGGLPFNVEIPNYKPEVLEAMEEIIEIGNMRNFQSYQENGWSWTRPKTGLVAYQNIKSMVEGA